MVTTTVSIEGIASPVTVDINEYTSVAVANAFSQQLAVLKQYLDVIPAGTPAPTSVTPLQNAIIALQSLAQTGITQSANWGDPGLVTGQQVTYYLTSRMADDLDVVLKSLAAVGITATTGTLNDVLAWQGLAGYGVSRVLQDAISVASADGNRSIQSVVELEYVTTASDVIFNNLSNLESALTTTQSVLNVLTALQRIHNNITVSQAVTGFATFDDYWKSELNAYLANNPGKTVQGMLPSSYAAFYESRADAYFAKATVKPTFNGNFTTDPTTLLNNIATYQNELNRLTTDFTTFTGLYPADVNASWLRFNGTTGYSAFVSKINNGAPYLNSVQSIIDAVTGFPSRDPLGTYTNIFGSLVPISQGLPPANMTNLTPQQLILYTYIYNFYHSYTGTPPVPATPVSVATFRAQVEGPPGDIVGTTWIADNSPADFEFLADFLSTGTGVNRALIATPQTYINAVASGQRPLGVISSNPITLSTVLAGLPQRYQDLVARMVDYENAYNFNYIQLNNTQNTYNSIVAPFNTAISFANQILAARDSLTTILNRIDLQNPKASRSIPNTLAFQLNTLLTDMNSRFGPATTDLLKAQAAAAWVLDGRTTATETGVVQGHIAGVITAAESLNDTQKENVRNYMFIFEEFYKSASNVLSQISQIITKIAQNISR